MAQRTGQIMELRVGLVSPLNGMTPGWRLFFHLCGECTPPVADVKFCVISGCLAMFSRYGASEPRVGVRAETAPQVTDVTAAASGSFADVDGAAPAPPFASAGGSPAASRDRW